MPHRPPMAFPRPQARHYPRRQAQIGSYTDKAWRRLRQHILTRDPICVSCHVRTAVICDHIITRRAGGSDDPANLRGICVPCDRRDSIRYDGSFGKPTRPGKQNDPLPR
jgi:5-methylcytosine-specific restriction endonuclease McrA